MISDCLLRYELRGTIRELVLESVGDARRAELERDFQQYLAEAEKREGFDVHLYHAFWDYYTDNMRKVRT